MIMTTDDSEKGFSDLLQEYQDQEGISHFEGSSGLKSLNKICNALGYSESPFAMGSSLEEFLKDNPLAMCAIVEWIADSSGDNFREELISNLNEPEEESLEPSCGSCDDNPNGCPICNIDD